MKDTLLQQIQMEAVDGALDLSNLLRKCRILAQRLNNSDLKSWVMQELDGYQPDAPLPAYRILSKVLILGDYFGAFSSEMRNVAIPISAIPEEFRDSIAGLRLIEGVKKIQDMIAHAKDGALRISIPPEAYRVIKNERVRADMVLGSAIKIINTATLHGILDSIRNRILCFTLELESEAPNTGDPLEGLRINKPDIIQQIYTTHILGNVGNISQGGTDYSQYAKLSSGDSEALKKFFLTVGLEDQETDELLEAAKSEKPNPDGTFGKRITALIGKVLTKASEGLLKIPSSVAGTLIAEAIKNYYGI